MENKAPLLPSAQLLSSPMLPDSRFDYFHQGQEEPGKKVHFLERDKKRTWKYALGNLVLPFV